MIQESPVGTSIDLMCAARQLDAVALFIGSACRYDTTIDGDTNMAHTVLLVDGDRLSRQCSSDTLGEAGISVVEATCIAEAVSAMTTSIDTVLADLKLPDGDGLALLQLVRKQFPDCPVIIASAHADKQSAIKALRLGAMDYLEKPISPPELVCSVNHTIEHRSLLLENRRLHEEQSLHAASALTDATGQLKSSLALLQQVVEHIPTRVFWKDRDSRFLGCNTLFARDAGLDSPAQLIGKTDAELSWRDQAALYRADDLQIMETNSPRLNFKETQTTPEGKTIWLRTSKIPLPDNHGNVCGVLGTYDDITEHQQLEEQFLAAQKMEAIGTLVGGIAHDFNNLLNGIMANAYMIGRKASADKKITAYTGDIQTLGFRAANMIGQLLTFARKGKVSLQSMPLVTFIKEAYKLASLTLPESINARFMFPKEELMVSADATQLQQLLMNLLNNARDAVADCQHPAINTELAAYTASPSFQRRHHTDVHTFALLSVCDNGTGIAADKIDKIFEPFFTTKVVGEGTGLGLAMVFGSVQTHGGFIEVESEVGSGTSFRIYLPVSDKPDATTEPDNQTVPQGAGEHILLIEDERELRDMLATMLTNMGYRVTTACDGEQGVASFFELSDTIDIVLADVVMPVMGGVDAAAAMHTIRPDLPVIFMTGYDKKQSIITGEQPEHCIVLKKPFSAAQISTALRERIAGIN